MTANIIRKRLWVFTALIVIWWYCCHTLQNIKNIKNTHRSLLLNYLIIKEMQSLLKCYWLCWLC